MFKRILRNIKFLKSFVAVVRDPTNTLEIFHVITDPRIINPATFKVVFNKLSENPKSRELLREHYAKEWNLDELLKLPVESFGYAYAKHMRDNGLDINFYPPVPGASDEAYVQMRSRQTHDIWHVLTGFDTSVPGEVGLQAFLQVQMSARSPTLIMVMFLLHCCIYKPSMVIPTTTALAKGWIMGTKAAPLFGEKFEESFQKNLNEYRRELNLEPYSG